MKTVSVREAADYIVAHVPLQPPLRIPLGDVVGHVLAEDVLAPFPLPRWTNAAMDGYAVRSDDVRGASRDTPVRLTVTMGLAAGDFPNRPIGAGQAARIYTGAPVPIGADSVIRQEDTDPDGDSVMIRDARDIGANVRVAGRDLAAGAVAVAAGTMITPRHVALLAALGVANPVAHRSPRVAILSTGDEIVPLDHPEEIAGGRRLADVNGPTLAALVRDAGGIAVPLGIARDDRDDVARLVTASSDWDMLISAGGASVGDHDHVRPVMSALGATIGFERVRVRPGGPTAFAVLPNDRPWLALPGNPVSAVVTFELFGRAAIRAMAGDRSPHARKIRATAGEALHPDRLLEQYLRCRFEWRDGATAPVATTTGPQGSGVLTSIARADGLLVVPPGGAVVAAGTLLEAIAFDRG